VFKFGGNKVSADPTGKFIVHLFNGGDWIFDVGEIGKLDAILSKYEKGVKSAEESVFWRTNGSKIIQVTADPSYITLIEGGKKTGYFRPNEIHQLRQCLRLLTSEGAPYSRSICLLDWKEESRYEELITTQQIPLNNRNSTTPLVAEREFTRETSKSVTADVSFGVGYDYYVTLNLEAQLGIKHEDKISERIMLRMEAAPGEFKIYTIIWKEIWVRGIAEFDFGGHREKVPFHLKSGLEPEIKQELLA
jgi:hypothetical protein